MPCKSGPFDKLMVLSKVEGHTSNADLTSMHHGGGCPDLSGPAEALIIGHDEKKTPPCPCVSPKRLIMARSGFQRTKMLQYFKLPIHTLKKRIFYLF